MKTFNTQPGARNSQTILKVVMGIIGASRHWDWSAQGSHSICGVGLGPRRRTAGGSHEPWEGRLKALPPGLRAAEGQCPREPCAASPVTRCPLPDTLSPPLTHSLALLTRSIMLPP